MPRASDMPEFQVGDMPVPTSTNPLGVKGAGKAGFVGSLPALVDAIADARELLGVDDVPLPATGSNIWKAIRSSRGRDSRVPTKS